MERLTLNFKTTDLKMLNLTNREREVLTNICKGDTNSEIAEKLNLSPKTIVAYKTKLLFKTKTRNSAHLVLFAMVNRMVDV